MRHHFVMRGDVKLDESTKSGEAVQRMKVEPRVLQRSPERLDHRIGKGHLDLGEDARQFFVIQQIVDGSVHVLTSRIRDDDRVPGTIVELNNGFAQYPTSSAATEPFLESPRQDSPGIVVDYRVQIRSRSIKQPDDRHVQMKEFPGSLRSDADFGFRGMDSDSGASPPRIPDKPIPRRWRGEDLADSLSVQRQGSQ